MHVQKYLLFVSCNYFLIRIVRKRPRKDTRFLKNKMYKLVINWIRTISVWFNGLKLIIDVIRKLPSLFSISSEHTLLQSINICKIIWGADSAYDSIALIRFDLRISSSTVSIISKVVSSIFHNLYCWRRTLAYLDNVYSCYSICSFIDYWYRKLSVWYNYKMLKY